MARNYRFQVRCWLPNRICSNTLALEIRLTHPKPMDKVVNLSVHIFLVGQQVGVEATSKDRDVDDASQAESAVMGLNPSVAIARSQSAVTGQQETLPEAVLSNCVIVRKDLTKRRHRILIFRKSESARQATTERKQQLATSAAAIQAKFISPSHAFEQVQVQSCCEWWEHLN